MEKQIINKTEAKEFIEEKYEDFEDNVEIELVIEEGRRSNKIYIKPFDDIISAFESVKRDTITIYIPYSLKNSFKKYFRTAKWNSFSKYWEIKRNSRNLNKLKTFFEELAKALKEEFLIIKKLDEEIDEALDLAISLEKAKEEIKKEIEDKEKLLNNYKEKINNLKNEIEELNKRKESADFKKTLDLIQEQKKEIEKLQEIKEKEENEIKEQINKIKESLNNLLNLEEYEETIKEYIILAENWSNDKEEKREKKILLSIIYDAEKIFKSIFNKIPIAIKYIKEANLNRYDRDGWRFREIKEKPELMYILVDNE